jgi:hypothetical protein
MLFWGGDFRQWCKGWSGFMVVTSSVYFIKVTLKITEVQGNDDFRELLYVIVQRIH